MKLKLAFLINILLLANIAMAYNITGNVTCEGEPMTGVVITRIGVTGGSNSDVAYAVTDLDGNYSIESGSGNQIMIVASFVDHISEMKWVDGSVVNFNLKETPSVPVKFFSTLLDQSAVLSFSLSQQIKSMGYPELADFKIYLSDDTLVFSLITTKDSAISGLSIKNLSDVTIKGYFKQLQSEGELDNFLSEMKSSGMKWGFGVYNKSTGEWIQYKSYDADQIRKLL